MKNKIFRGVATAIVTPFTDENTIDETSLRNFLEFQIQNGIHAIVPVGSTGEAATLTNDERERVIKITKEHTMKKVPVIAGTGTNDTKTSIQNTLQAAAAGADAALVVCPYYNKPSQLGLIEHFTAIANASPIPILLYNVPGRTAVNLIPDTVLALAKHEKIYGIKEASGDVSQMLEILNKKPQDFAFYSGDDDLFLPLASCGADGVISVASNEIPKELTTEWNFIEKGYLQAAREIHFKYLDLMNINFCESNPVPVKTALSIMGYMKDNVRLPLTKATIASRKNILDILGNVGL